MLHKEKLKSGTKLPKSTVLLYVEDMFLAFDTEFVTGGGIFFFKPMGWSIAF